jgi:hypothetical protein
MGCTPAALRAGSAEANSTVMRIRAVEVARVMGS